MKTTHYRHSLLCTSHNPSIPDECGAYCSLLLLVFCFFSKWKTIFPQNLPQRKRTLDSCGKQIRVSFHIIRNMFAKVLSAKPSFRPVFSLRQFSTGFRLNAITRKHNYETEATISVDPKTGKKIFKKPMTINTELPDDPRQKERLSHLVTFLVFAFGMTAACMGIFNYEKVSSPIMNATMYFLRRSEHARELLGRKITYDGLVPWISGEVNTVKGFVDCSANLCGDKGSAKMILRAEKIDNEKFTIIEWVLIGQNGEIVDLTHDASVDLMF